MRPMWVLTRHTLTQLLGGKRLWIITALVILALWPTALVAGGSVGDGARVMVDLGRNLLLPLLVPVVTMVFAASAAGDEVRDGTMVNLVLKPYPRDLIVAAQYLATVTAVLVVLVPVEVVAHLLAARGPGNPAVLVGVLLATLIAVLAWGALGLLLGLLVSRALLIGIAWILLWESTVAGAAEGAAAFSLRGWTEAVLAAVVRGEGMGFTTRLGPVTSLICALLVAAGAFLLATRRLHRMDLR